LQREGPALVIQVAEPQVLVQSGLDLTAPRVAAVDAAAGWLMLRGQRETGLTLLVLLAGLSEITLQADTELARDARLGVVDSALMLVVRQVGDADPVQNQSTAVAAWSNPGCVAVDPRNVLLARSGSPAAPTPAGTFTE
jgi:hypothetical protein